jgi:hypothetical protein
VHRLEAALDRTCPQHRESCHRPGDPLELLWPEAPQLEEIAEPPARGLSNDDRVRLGDGLKACREVRRLPANLNAAVVPALAAGVIAKNSLKLRRTKLYTLTNLGFKGIAESTARGEGEVAVFINPNRIGGAAQPRAER